MKLSRFFFSISVLIACWIDGRWTVCMEWPPDWASPSMLRKVSTYIVMHTQSLCRGIVRFEWWTNSITTTQSTAAKKKKYRLTLLEQHKIQIVIFHTKIITVCAYWFSIERTLYCCVVWVWIYVSNVSI